MLDCKHASRLLSQLQERPLSLRERLGLKLHLWLCDACRNFSRQLGLLHAAVRKMAGWAEHDATVRLPDEARERIARQLHEHQ